MAERNLHHLTGHNPEVSLGVQRGHLDRLKVRVNVYARWAPKSGCRPPDLRSGQGIGE